MARNRSSGSEHLPKYVHQKNGAFYYVRDGKWTRLGDTLADAYAGIARMMGAKPVAADGSAPASAEASGSGISLAEVIDRAMPSVTKHLSKGTAQTYGSRGKWLKGKLPDVALADLRPKHVFAIRREWKDRPASFNTILTVLRQCVTWALEQDFEGFEINPIAGVKLLTAGGRSRYITHAEYLEIYHAAPLSGVSDPERLQVAMELCYRTGQRIGDVVKIKREDCTEEGVYFRQAKTDAQVCVDWSPELRSAIARAMALDGGKASPDNPFVMRGRGMRSVASNSIYKAWCKVVAKTSVKDVTIHDIRAKAATDVEESAEMQGGDGMLAAQTLLGHGQPSMTKRYLRGRKAKRAAGPSGSFAARRAKQGGALSMDLLKGGAVVSALKAKGAA